MIQMVGSTTKTRCSWCGNDPLYVKYHDTEWGKPEFKGQKLFEMLCLEGAQAGLSWITVLKKRAHYRKVYHKFNINKVASMTDSELEKLLQDPGIIRNRLKVYGFRKNAQALNYHFKNAKEFSDFLWSFVDHEPVVNSWKSLSEIPAKTETSDKMSKALKKKGFTFVGSTICYAFMQATGMVNDHTTDCFLFFKRY
ncbi:DNA-3-methyladenine glycosylase I [Pleionea sediminis]|uniref:DNA-3-methyladenine glycosylase I n=1 Tax=Pleionea sediminis TaxID=2569479 RepID=UPI002482D58B|nr:DNA-3-methyladenine glycosylase I [Pleionea sediminis]